MREGFLRPELRLQSVCETYAFVCDWIAVRLKRDGEFEDAATQQNCSTGSQPLFDR